MVTTSERWARLAVWVLNHIPFGPRYSVEPGEWLTFEPEPVSHLVIVPDKEDANARSTPE